MAKPPRSKPGRAIVPAGDDDDRFIPDHYVGKLEPNYYCRGWNEKRQKYCKSEAGWGTTHPGQGRCRMHGGLQVQDGRVRTGRYSGIRSSRIQELLEEYSGDPDPLNVVEDLHLARALLRDYIERASAGRTQHVPESKLLRNVLDEYEIRLRDGAEPTNTELEQLAKARTAIDTLTAERALPDIAEAVKMLDVVSKMIHRVEQLRTAGAVSLDQVRRFLGAVDRVLQLHVDDDKLRTVIRRDIYAIRV